MQYILKKSSFSWDIVFFKYHEIFSPFLIKSWDSFFRLHPLHQNFSPSYGIYRLKILKAIILTVYFEEIMFLLGSYHFKISWEFLPIYHHLVGLIFLEPIPSMRRSLHHVWYTDKKNINRYQGLVSHFQIPWEFLFMSPHLWEFT